APAFAFRPAGLDAGALSANLLGCGAVVHSRIAFHFHVLVGRLDCYCGFTLDRHLVEFAHQPCESSPRVIRLHRAFPLVTTPQWAAACVMMIRCRLSLRGPFRDVMA